MATRRRLLGLFHSCRVSNSFRPRASAGNGWKRTSVAPNSCGLSTGVILHHHSAPSVFHGALQDGRFSRVCSARQTTSFPDPGFSQIRETRRGSGFSGFRKNKNKNNCSAEPSDSLRQPQKTLASEASSPQPLTISGWLQMGLRPRPHLGFIAKPKEGGQARERICARSLFSSSSRAPPNAKCPLRATPEGSATKWPCRCNGWHAGR